jgi:ZIP family zinc transporter
MSTSAPTGTASSLWGLAILPVLLLGAVLAYLVATGGGLRGLQGPPVEQIKIGRITLPERGLIQLKVVNDGPQAITIPQVMVDDAFWAFTAEPPGPIPRLGSATLTIPYPWVQNEAHTITLVSSIGMTFSATIPVAFPTPRLDGSLFARFGLVGLYVGVVPVLLGMLWYPWMRRLSSQAMNFILSLTVGLLIFLVIGTWTDAQEFTVGLPVFWQGASVISMVALLTVGILTALGSRRKSSEEPLGLSYRIATGIGLHNLGEGLAIGSAFALGESALGTFLILGFTLHNITEGVGIVAPLTRRSPGLKQFLLLGLLAGGPAILGTWIGGFAFDPVLSTIFLAIGVGAIAQVIWEVGRLVARNSQKLGLPVAGWTNLGGLAVGLGIMYFTAFFVKF